MDEYEKPTIEEINALIEATLKSEWSIQHYQLERFVISTLLVSGPITLAAVARTLIRKKIAGELI